MRVVIYARYSSDLQRDASIDDQIRLCEEHAARQGWIVLDPYSDRSTSGVSLIRPGIQKLMRDAAARGFHIILTEVLDRLSRDQEDIAALYKRLRFAGVRIVTLSEGEISELHVGLKGTMNALYLKDLADKTRRGLRGRVEAGFSGGGNSYGYDVLKRVGPDGQPICGERRVNTAEAAVVRRIFDDYARGLSPRAIAKRLNEEQVPGPSGRAWETDAKGWRLVVECDSMSSRAARGRRAWGTGRSGRSAGSRRCCRTVWAATGGCSGSPAKSTGGLWPRA